MFISNIFSTYQSCEETQRMKNRSALSEKHRAKNKAEAIKMLKKGVASKKAISEKTGISRTRISVYKSELNKVA